jgi:hypothetical protein
MITRILVVLAILIALIVAYFVFRGDDEVSADESPYDGVHLCAPDQQAAATAEARVRTEPVALGDGSQPPFFSQTSAEWGALEYDHGADQDVGCGKTIAQCGCAMTSVATVLQVFQVVSTPAGDNLNPATLNDWFNQGAQLTQAGWSSQGFVFGNVVWTAVNGWTPEPSELASTEIAAPPPQGIRFDGWGSGSEDEIRRELEAGRPVILEVPGHYIAAVGLQGDQILINDPYYRDRVTLQAYAGRVKSSRLYRPSDDLRSLVVTVPAGQRVKVTDSQGRSIGDLETDDLSQVQSDFPGATIQFEEAWRDPTCTERPPEPGSGVITLFLPLPETGIYSVEVFDPDGEATAAVYTSDVNGVKQVKTREGEDDLSFDVDYDAGKPVEEPEPEEPDRPQPDEPDEPQPPEPEPDQPAQPNEPEEPQPAEPEEPEEPPLEITALDVALDQIDQFNPCHVDVSWSVSGGGPDTVVRLLRQAGTSINAASATQVSEGGTGPDFYRDPNVFGTRTYLLEATSASQTASDTLTSSPICIQSFTANAQPDLPYRVSLSFRVAGDVPGATYTLSKEGDSTSGSVQYGQTQSFTDTDLECGTTYEYRLQIDVGNREVNANPVSATTPDCDPINIDSFALTSLGQSQFSGGICRHTVSWTVSGPDDTLVELLRDSSVIMTAGVGSESLSRSFFLDVSGSRTYQLRASSASTGETVLSGTIQLNPICIRSFEAHICGLSDTFTRFSWDIDGSAAATLSIGKQLQGTAVYQAPLPANNDGNVAPKETSSSWYLWINVNGQLAVFGPISPVTIVC